MMTCPSTWSATQIATAVATGKRTARAIVEAHLDAITQQDRRLNAFLSVLSDSARADADALDRDLAQGRSPGRLSGVPVAIKDIFDVSGTITTCHSRGGPPQFVAHHDASAVTRLRQSGAILIGKTALHEFATGGPSFDLPWPPARNPWNTDHHPGGSSSGSAVAVAARMAPVALGTDTSGSVRHPATACGILGMKPTYDAISRDGVFPLSPTMDHVGPLARSVEDIALMYDVLRGKNVPFDLMQARLPAALRCCVFGVSEQFIEGADPDVIEGFLDSLEVLKKAGAIIAPLQLSALQTYAGCGRMIIQAEAYAFHKDWIDARPAAYGRRGRQRILAGRSIDAASYINAQRLRARLTEEMSAALSKVDAVLCPSSLATACRIDDPLAIDASYDQQARTPFNLTGHPAVSLPTGVGPLGLPLGLQIVGPHWCETRLLALAAGLEAVLQPMPAPPHIELDGDSYHVSS